MYLKKKNSLVPQVICNLHILHNKMQSESEINGCFSFAD